MVDHIVQVAKKLHATMLDHSKGNVFEETEVLANELRPLDPMDFEPAVRQDFVFCRHRIEKLAQEKISTKIAGHAAHVEKLIGVLEGYLGEGSGGSERSFAFVVDKALGDIIKRDYAELNRRLYPARAWKSTVIMAGSILEAILHDRLSAPSRNTAALASSSSPSQQMDRWTLEQLINVAVEINAIPVDLKNLVHQTLRDYRNFVHPKREIRSAHACGETHAGLAKHALDAVCDHCEANP